MDIQEHIDILIDDYYSKAMKSLNSINANLNELELFASLLKKRKLKLTCNLKIGRIIGKKSIKFNSFALTEKLMANKFSF